MCNEYTLISSFSSASNSPDAANARSRISKSVVDSASVCSHLKNLNLSNTTRPSGRKCFSKVSKSFSKNKLGQSSGDTLHFGSDYCYQS